jgi:hypothetical protein
MRLGVKVRAVFKSVEAELEESFYGDHRTTDAAFIELSIKVLNL